MAKNHSVQVLEVCTVAPPCRSLFPSPSSTSSGSDSLQFNASSSTKFRPRSTPSFPTPKTPSPSFCTTISPHAGTIVWPEHSPKPIVESAVGDGEAAELHSLVPELPAAVVALQVTSFPNVGFCIGISSHRAILDGRSSTSFLKSWARACKNFVAGESSEPVFSSTEQRPFYHRSLVPNPAGLEGIYLKDWLAVGGPNDNYICALENSDGLDSTYFLA